MVYYWGCVMWWDRVALTPWEVMAEVELRSLVLVLKYTEACIGYGDEHALRCN